MRRWLSVAFVATAGLVGSVLTVPAAAEQAPSARDVSAVAYGSDPAQLLDLHLPATAGRHPVVVYLHAGGWKGGSRTDVPDFLLAEVTRRGVAIVSVDYRLAGYAADGAPINAFPVPNQDVDQAIRFLRANASTWSLDPRMVIVAGSSSGGHLALMAAAAPGKFVSPALPAALRKVSPKVQGVIDFVGPVDLAWMLHQGILFDPEIVETYLGCPAGQPDQCDDARLRQASPMTYVHAGLPPAFLVYGAQDRLIPPDSQGAPLALAWAAARGDLTRQADRRGTRFELASEGHNVDPSNFELPSMQAWLDGVLARTVR